MSLENVKKEAERWLKQAREDFSAAEILAREVKYAQSCFYSQQATEKALKALWHAYDDEPWGHSVCRLIEELKEGPVRNALMQLHEDAQLLDRFYIPTRYPNGLPDLIPQEAYGARDAREGLDAAQRIMDVVRREFVETK